MFFHQINRGAPFVVMIIFFSAAVAVASPQAKGPITYKEIIFTALKVKTADGVDKKEAVLLAQKYLIDKGFEKELEISKGKIEKFDKISQVWLVNFPSKSHQREFRQVWVSSKDGTVITSVIK